MLVVFCEIRLFQIYHQTLKAKTCDYDGCIFCFNFFVNSMLAEMLLIWQNKKEFKIAFTLKIAQSTLTHKTHNFLVKFFHSLPVKYKHNLVMCSLILFSLL